MASAGGGDGDEYLVECILEEKEKNGRRMYLVLWKDYSKDEASWEPAENVKGCEALKIWEKRGATGTAGPADRPEHGDDAAAQLKFFTACGFSEGLVRAAQKAGDGKDDAVSDYLARSDGGAPPRKKRRGGSSDDDDPNDLDYSTESSDEEETMNRFALSGVAAMAPAAAAPAASPAASSAASPAASPVGNPVPLTIDELVENIGRASDGEITLDSIPLPLEQGSTFTFKQALPECVEILASVTMSELAQMVRTATSQLHTVATADAYLRGVCGSLNLSLSLSLSLSRARAHTHASNAQLCEQCSLACHRSQGRHLQERPPLRGQHESDSERSRP